MSIFSKLFKGVKKILKGAHKIAKKTFALHKKVFKIAEKWRKKFMKSKIGKAIMIAVAIYFGGVALGAWGGAGSAGATAGSTLGATTGAGTGATVVTSAAPALASEIATTAIGTTAGTAAGAGTLAATAAPVVELTAASALPGAAAATATPGLVGAATDLATTAGSSALGWMQANPALTIAGAQGVSAALAPDPYAEARRDEEDRRRRMNIAGIYGTGEGTPLGLGLIERTQTQDLYTPTYQQQPLGG